MERPDEVSLETADLLAVVGGHLHAVQSHVGGVQLSSPITCIWHFGGTPSHSSAL